jgi:hypothetical protein
LKKIWVFNVILNWVGDGIMLHGRVVSGIPAEQLLLPLFLHHSLQLILILELVVDPILPVHSALGLQLFFEVEALLVLLLALLPGPLVLLGLAVLLLLEEGERVLEFVALVLLVEVALVVEYIPVLVRADELVYAIALQPALVHELVPPLLLLVELPLQQ